MSLRRGPPARARSWAEHWSRGPMDLARRFNDLSPRDVRRLCEEHGLVARGEPESLGSVENRVYRCDVSRKGGPAESVVVKLYRPWRWSAEALREEMVFLHDIAEAGVDVVRPRGARGQEVHTWRGIAFVIFEAERLVGRPAGPLGALELRGLGRLLARVHVAAARREAAHRMTIDARKMALGNLRVVARGGLLPGDLLSEYTELCIEIAERSAPLLSGVPVHRLHGDFGVHNLLWTARGIVVVDLDDFMVGPAAFDLCRVYVGVKTPWGDPDSDEAARDRATQAVLDGYREVLPLPEEHARPIEALRALRMIWNDAWKQARLHDPHFCRARSVIRERGFWLPRMAFLRGQAAKLRRT